MKSSCSIIETAANEQHFPSAVYDVVHDDSNYKELLFDKWSDDKLKCVKRRNVEVVITQKKSESSQRESNP